MKAQRVWFSIIALLCFGHPDVSYCARPIKSKKKANISSAHVLSTTGLKGETLICSFKGKTPLIGSYQSQSRVAFLYLVANSPTKAERKILLKARKECLALKSSPPCGDRRDNDLDGIRDYPSDKGCSSAEDSSEIDENDSTNPYLVFRKPFDGDFQVGSLFDHQFPLEFIHEDGVVVNSYNEITTTFLDGHQGYDYIMPEGTPILASYDGEVYSAGAETPFLCPLLGQTVSGLSVILKHAVNGEEFYSVYAHFSSIEVTSGQTVLKGEQLGLSGNTGCSTGPHLHFDILRTSNSGIGTASIDPFGWNSSQIDPWSVHESGSPSYRLWAFGEAPSETFYFSVDPNPNEGDRSPVALTTFQYIGALDDQNPNNEFIELTLDTRFSSGTSFSLSNFTLKNNRGESYTFPKGVTLRDGQNIRVYSGLGTNNSSTLFWGRNSQAWNNDGDCARLSDASKNLYYSLSYGTQGCVGVSSKSSTAIAPAKILDIQPPK